MSREFQPEAVDTWFPLKYQQQHANHITGQCGLTPTQARHFVKLWAYGHAKHHGSDTDTIEVLERKIDSFFCSHREAALLFYGASQGSTRSAGLMLDKFVAKQLVRRESFQGSTTRLSLHIPEGFDLFKDCQFQEIYTDQFDPRNDTSFVAMMLEELFVFDVERPKTLLQNFRRMLREWAKRYPEGLRVLRYSLKNNRPIALSTVFPIHPDSEICFDLPPSEGLYVTKLHLGVEDPIQFPSKNSSECHVAYIRGWNIHKDFWNYENALRLFKDTQESLRKMQNKFPNLSDLYTISLHPRMADFALNLGFELMVSDPDTSMSWLYMPLDKFLAIDGEDILLNFDYSYYAPFS